jgi:phosphatidylglycerophosphatase A
MRDKVIKFLATGAYVGLSPVMPGTVGTLWGIPIAWALTCTSTLIDALIIIALFVVAVIVSGEAERIDRKKDPSSVIIDEIVGFLVAIFYLPFTLFTVVAAFVLFRFFDILKPFPIGLIDRRVKGGAGIVIDDVVAGIFANVVLQIIMTLWR